MTPEQILANARVFALPLHREFRGVTVREGLLFEGPNGWGEFAPFHDHSDVHAARWLEAALEQAFGDWPALARHAVPVNAIVPVADVAVTKQLVDEALACGCTTIKTKVGAKNFDDDVARVAAIRESLDDAGVDGAIRIDTNQRWTLEEAIERVAVLDAIAGGLEYVEQPVETLEDLRQLRRSVDVRIAVDEGLRLAENAMLMLPEIREIADILVLKAIPLGGVAASLAIAEQAGMPVVVSGSLDSSVGLASGLWLAGALAELHYACGLGTGALLAQDTVRAPQQIDRGTLQVQREVPEEPDPVGLVDAEMTARWRARFLAAWQHAHIPNAVKAS